MKLKKIYTISLFFLGALNVFNLAQASPVDYSKNPFAKKYVYEGHTPPPRNKNNENKVENPTTNSNKGNATYSLPHALPSNSGNIKSGKYQHLYNNSASLQGCWDKAGKAYNIDPWLLFAIAKVESSFNSKAINKNKDKRRSTDVGMMQINTFWFPILAKHGIQEEHLYDPCTSVFVGAWIVAQNIQRFGYNQDGIGAYNSPNNIKIRRNYAKKVYAAYYELLNDFGIKATKK